jgi:hypothetical protein
LSESVIELTKNAQKVARQITELIRAQIKSGVTFETTDHKTLKKRSLLENICPNRYVIPIASFKKSTRKIVSQSEWKDKCDSDANMHIEHGKKHRLTRKSMFCILLATQYSLVDACLGNIFGN